MCADSPPSSLKPIYCGMLTRFEFNALSLWCHVSGDHGGKATVFIFKGNTREGQGRGGRSDEILKKRWSLGIEGSNHVGEEFGGSLFEGYREEDFWSDGGDVIRMKHLGLLPLDNDISSIFLHLSRAHGLRDGVVARKLHLSTPKQGWGGAGRKHSRANGR